MQMKKLVFILLFPLYAWGQTTDANLKSVQIDPKIRNVTISSGITKGNVSDVLQAMVNSKISRIEANSTSGTNTYTTTISWVTGYSFGLNFPIVFNSGNTGASTLNINTIGAVALKKNSSSALVSGDLVAGQVFWVFYDGTNFQVIGIGGGSVSTGNLTTTTTGVSLTGNTGAVIGSGTTINIQNATTSQIGLLTNTDWNTFNQKLPATSGTSLVAGNGSGGLLNINIGSNLSYNTGTQTLAASVVGTSGSFPLKGNGSGGFLNLVWPSDNQLIRKVAGNDYDNSGISSDGTTATFGAVPNFPSQTQNKSFMSPNGSSGVPSFRSIVVADVSGLGTVATKTAPSGTSTQLIANDGSGGFSNVTVGSGLSYSGGTLTATGGGTVTSVSGTTNRITSTGGTTPIIDISSTFEGLLGKVASPLSQFAPTTSAQLRGVLSDELGTGADLFDGATPTSLTLTNATGLPISTGVSGLGSNVSAFLATPSGANLASALTTPIPVTAGGSGTSTPAIVAGTNVTVTGSWPNQTISSAPAAYVQLGTRYNQLYPSGTSAGNNLTKGGSTATVSYSGGVLTWVLSNSGTELHTESLQQNNYSTSLERWSRSITFKVNALNSHTVGIALGTSPIISGTLRNEYSVNITSAGVVSFNAYCSTAAFISVGSFGTAMTVAVNDVCTFSVIKNVNVTTFILKNTTQGKTVSWSPDTGVGLGPASSFQPIAYNLGGSWDVSQDIFTSPEQKSPQYIFVGDSKTAGTSYNKEIRYPDILFKGTNTTYVVYAISYNYIRGFDANCIAEINEIAQGQSTIIVLGGSNDKAIGGDSDATIRTNLNNFVTGISTGAGAGNTVWVCRDTPRNGIAMSNIAANIATDYPTSNIDLYYPFLLAGGTNMAFSDDGTHPTFSGHEMISDIITKTLNLTSVKPKGLTFTLPYAISGTDIRLYDASSINTTLTMQNTGFKYLTKLTYTDLSDATHNSNFNIGGGGGTYNVNTFSQALLGGYYGKNTNATGFVRTILENDRGSFASFTALTHAGSTCTQLDGDFGLAQGRDWGFLFTGGASNNGLAIGTLVAKPLLFGTNNVEVARFIGTGQFGLGVTSPTALLHIKAGTATASTAPLKFTAPAALLATPEALTIEPAINGDYLNLTTTTGTIRRVVVAGSSGRATAQTALNNSVATYTLGATDASYEVSANVLVTTSSAENFTVTVSYTDEGNTARTATFNFQLLGGTIGTAINFANGAIPYESFPLHIRCKASTAITVKTTGTFTGATYNVEGIIKQTN